jgi:enoyl-CoA hydratase
VITLNRPTADNADNAVTQSMSVALAAAIDLLDGDDELSVGILTGSGASFCSGMDLKSFLKGEVLEVPGRGFGGFTRLPPVKPMIAAVEGYALAGGFELALACDLIVAAESAQFGLPEVRRGLIAGSGGLLRLGKRMPLNVAMEYVLTGRNLSAAEAERWDRQEQALRAIFATADAAEGASAFAEKRPPSFLGC